MSQADLPIGMRQHTFTETTPDATLHFQILDIGRQIYVWMSTGTPSLSQLAFGIQTQVEAAPAVTSLMQDSAKSDTPSLAGRLTAKLKRPVLCCCNIPNSTPLLQAIAERRLLQELKALGYTA